MIYLYKQFPIDEVQKIISRDFNNHEIVRITDEIIDESIIKHSLESENLFLTPRLIFISGIQRDFWDTVIESLSYLPATTTVVWLEDSFPVAYLKKVPKHTVSEYKDKKTTTKANPFSIANTLTTGNGSAIWVVYQDLINQGFAPEELFGIIWWKLKDIAKKKTTISDSFKKTLHTFMSTYADARATAGDLETGLEKTLLSITKKDLV